MPRQMSKWDDLLYVEDLEDFEEDFEEEEAQPLTPESELSRLLSIVTMPQLREIARNRGIKVVAKNKAELIEQLISPLLDPDGIDAALAELDAESRLLLAIADIAGQAIYPTTHVFVTALKRLGKKPGASIEKGSLASLVRLGLLFPDQQGYQRDAYRVPTTVSPHLQGCEDLLQPLARLPKGPQARTGLGLSEAMQAIVHEIARGAIGKEVPRDAYSLEGYPIGWLPGGDGREQSQTTYWTARAATLRPAAPLLPEPDLQSLVARTGSASRMLEFALYLLVAGGVLTPPSTPTASWGMHAEALQRLLVMRGSERIWLSLRDWLDRLPTSLELGPLVAGSRAFTLHSYLYGYTTALPGIIALRRLVARAVGHLPVDGTIWYGFDQFLGLLGAIAPDLLAQQQWWITVSGGRRLDLNKESDWLLLWGPLVAAMLSGPLQWLGLVDVAYDDGRLVAFRPTLFSDALRDRATNYTPAVDRYPVSIDGALVNGEPEVLLTPGTPFWPAQSLLAEIGEVSDVTPSGLRYRVTRRRLHEVLQTGRELSTLTGSLENYSGGPLPRQVRTTIQSWWESYGSVRLYDDVTVVELADSLLSELRAHSWFEDAIVFTFSPTLVALAADRADDVVARIRRLGYTPRDLEGI